MKQFHTICASLNLATVLIYGTIVHAQFDGLEDHTTTVLIPATVSEAKCEKGDCNLAVFSTGSGADLEDGCTKTGNICTGSCFRCQGNSPTEATGYCKKKNDTTEACVIAPLSGTKQGKFECGDSHKYQCKKNGDGPSTCCSKTQDGTTATKGSKCSNSHTCDWGQNMPTDNDAGDGTGGTGDPNDGGAGAGDQGNGDGGAGDPGGGDGGAGELGDGDGGAGEPGDGDAGTDNPDPQMPTEP